MGSPIVVNLALFLLYSAVGLIAYKSYRFYTLYFNVPSNPLQNYKRKDGPSWALVSGSSTGIGYALADSLLSHGFNVIIFAHEGIQEAESKLRAAHPSRQIKALTLDCIKASQSDIESLRASLQRLPITVLINNVGGIPVAPPSVRPFEDFDALAIDATITLNMRFMTQLTQLMLPLLKANAAPRSLILNLSSAGNIGLPYIPVYCACKAYSAVFSAALAREFWHRKVPVDSIAILPGQVRTSANRHAQRGALTPERFATEVMSRVDEAVRRRIFVLVPYWAHKLEHLAAQMLPEGMVVPHLAAEMERMMGEMEKEVKTR